MALVYLFSVLFKLRGDEWLSLAAIRQSFAVEGVATDFARWLLQYPDLLSAAAAATLAIESLAVVLPFRALAHRSRCGSRSRSRRSACTCSASARRCASG